MFKLDIQVKDACEVAFIGVVVEVYYAIKPSIRHNTFGYRI